MSDSPIAKDVILEVGHIEDGNVTTNVPIITGYNTYQYPGENSCHGCDGYDRPRNSMTEFTKSDFHVDGFKMKIRSIKGFGIDGSYLSNYNEWFGPSNGNVCGYQYMMWNYSGGQYLTDSYLYSDMYVFQMEKADGTPAEFNGISYSHLGTNGQAGVGVANHIDQYDAYTGANRADTEQGRILYLQRDYNNPGTYVDENGNDQIVDFGMSFEIIDGCEDLLVVRGTGKENPADYLANNHNIKPGTEAFMDASFLGSFDCFISPYVHKANWFYQDDKLTYNSDFRGIHLYWVQNYNDKLYSPTFREEGVLGIRSNKKLLVEENDCNYYGAGCQLKFNVVDNNNASVRVLFGNAANPFTIGGYADPDYEYMCNNYTGSGTTSHSPWTWETFSGTGLKESCPYLYRDTYYTTNYWFPGTDETYHVPDVKVALGGGGNSAGYKRIWSGSYPITGSQHEFIKVVPVSGSTKTILSINLFEVYESDPSEGNSVDTLIEVPIWGTQTVNEATYTYQHLDILDRTQALMALTYNAADLRDPSKRAAGYSKTFEIPASNHNQKWIETLTAVGSQRDLEKIGWHKARIKANGIYVFDGWARFEIGITGQGGRYKCHILQDPSYWPELIKNLKVCDISFPTHEKSYDTITASWGYTVDQIPYVYPAINYGEWFQGANSPKSLKDFHPAVYAKAIVDKIFSGIGYTIESNFFNTDEFKKLIIPYTSGEDYDNASNPLGENGSFGAGGHRAGESDPPDIPACGWSCCTYRKWFPTLQYETGNVQHHAHNTSNSSCNNGYTVPFTGRYVVHYDCQMKQSQGWGDGGKWCLVSHINGQIVSSNVGSWYSGMSSSPNSVYQIGNGTGTYAIPTGAPYNAVGVGGYGTGWQFNSWASNGDWKTGTISYEIDLQQGDKIQIGFYGRNNNNVATDYSQIKNENFFVYPHVSNTAVPTSVVNLSSSLPCIKQKDFLKGLTNLFNLHWTSDERTRTVSVEPYDDFYGSGKTLDFTDRLDHTSWSDKFLIDELASTIHWKYKPDSNDRIVELYNQSMDTELWSLDIENGELYRRDEKDMGNKVFSPTFRLKGNSGDLTWGNSSASGPIMPVMWEGNPCNWGWFNSTTRPDNSTKFNIRIINWGGMSPCNTWQFTDSSGVNHTHNTYPYAYTYNYNNNPATAYPNNLSWYNIGSGATFQRGLFDRYYGNLYEKISGGAALRKCKMNLSANDIAMIDMRDVIKLKIDGVYTYWTINKIKDYQPGQDKLTDVELIEWKYNDGSKNVFGGKFNTKGGQSDATPKGKLNQGQTTFSGDGHTGIIVNENENGLKFITNIDKNILDSTAPQSDDYHKIKDKGSSNQGVSVCMDSKVANKTGSNSIAMGQGLNVSNNQIVLGTNNQHNPRDLFQIGSGYIDDQGEKVGVNALSVSHDGEISIYGGEVVADFKTGDLTLTGDVYVEVQNPGGGGDTVNGVDKIRKKLYIKK